MRYGFIMPGGDARRAAELAALAEQHGWDGFFVWEGIWAVDAWAALTAAAMRTERDPAWHHAHPAASPPARGSWPVKRRPWTTCRVAG